jgi:hypothetical protein
MTNKKFKAAVAKGRNSITPLSVEHIANSIMVFHGQRVLLDNELAALYSVPTNALNQTVKRNIARFPEDFVFILSNDETKILNRSQFVTGSQKHRDPRFPPRAFTEHGAIMAATVLNSSQAIETSIYVVRAFVQLRNWLASNKALAQKLQQLERKVASHDQSISEIVKTIRELMTSQVTKRRPIGFTADLNSKD